MKVTLLILLLTPPVLAEHSSPSDFGSLENSGLPRFSSLRTLAVTSEVRNAVLRDRPQSWQDLERSLGVSLLPPGAEARLPLFDANGIEEALQQVSQSLQAHPPSNWNQLAQNLAPLTEVIPADLVQSFIVQKVLEREEEGQITDPSPDKDGTDPGVTGSRAEIPMVGEEAPQGFLPHPGTFANPAASTRAKGFSQARTPISKLGRTRFTAPIPTPLALAKNQWLAKQAPKREQLDSLLKPSELPVVSVSPPGPVLDESPDQTNAKNVNPSALLPQLLTQPLPFPNSGPLPPTEAPRQPRSLAGTTQGNPIQLPAPLPPVPGGLTEPPTPARNPKTRPNLSPRLGLATAALASSSLSYQETESPKFKLGTFPQRVSQRDWAARLAAAIHGYNKKKRGTGKVETYGDFIRETGNPQPPLTRKLASLTGLSLPQAHRLYQTAQVGAWGGTLIWIWYVGLYWWRRGVQGR